MQVVLLTEQPALVGLAAATERPRQGVVVLKKRFGRAAHAVLRDVGALRVVPLVHLALVFSRRAAVFGPPRAPRPVRLAPLLVLSSRMSASRARSITTSSSRLTWLIRLRACSSFSRRRALAMKCTPKRFSDSGSTRGRGPAGAPSKPRPRCSPFGDSGCTRSGTSGFGNQRAKTSRMLAFVFPAASSRSFSWFSAVNRGARSDSPDRCSLPSASISSTSGYRCAARVPEMARCAVPSLIPRPRTQKSNIDE